MAEPKKKQANEQSPEQESQPRKGKGSKLMPYLMPVLTIVLCAAGGFAAGRLFGTRGHAQNVSAAEAVGEDLPPLPPIKTSGAETF